jgi:hypothetical protein
MKRPVKVKPIASNHRQRERAAFKSQGRARTVGTISAGRLRRDLSAFYSRSEWRDISPAQRVIRGVRRDLRDGSHVRPGHSSALAPQLMALPLPLSLLLVRADYAATVMRVSRVG